MGVGCEKHPYAAPGPGVCAVCLRQRLEKVAGAGAGAGAAHAGSEVLVQPAFSQDVVKPCKSSFTLLSLFKKSDEEVAVERDAGSPRTPAKASASWLSSLLTHSKSKSRPGTNNPELTSGNDRAWRSSSFSRDSAHFGYHSDSSLAKTRSRKSRKEIKRGGEQAQERRFAEKGKQAADGNAKQRPFNDTQKEQQEQCIYRALAGASGERFRGVCKCDWSPVVMPVNPQMGRRDTCAASVRRPKIF